MSISSFMITNLQYYMCKLEQYVIELIDRYN